ncbi:hypothetical protein BT67DRAFT_425092 [Trichocladium antarcticum]|uniref:Uncharacterized protein n=1 Tax=Trichocladium antarcticum TaxID=1450529 RepID=A0AAN6UH90_9PEZI|nr:hypothetical protein BT67DRAFT_425092 [Trichocladium antarcticum]
MGKKKRGHPDVEDLLGRPWCYYCERDFEDLKLLISHQKAKHFKCDRCGKRLNTAGGLSVHMNQVHKENLTSVENALPNRQGLDIEIFGMEGVPEEIIQQHNQRIIQNFYTAQAERQAATGNPPRGLSGDQGPTKKIKYESPEELKKRLAEHRARVKAGGGIPAPAAAPVDGLSPAQGNPPFPPPQQAFPYPPPGVPAYPPAATGTYPPSVSPPPGGSFPPLPARPTVGGPTQPPGGAPPYFYNGAAATADELVANAARQGGGGGGGGGVRGDDIDQLIRMAEAGIKPARTGEEAREGGVQAEKKKKGSRMVYADTEVSPEERMAGLARYRWVGEGVVA